MELIRGLHNVRPQHRNGVITIGTFDGVHHGHQMLLSHLRAKASELHCTSMLVTFEPQPREYFRGAVVPARLTRFREKIAILRECDVDYVLCIPFNERTSATPAEVVINDFLVRILGVRYLVVGDDFRFGKNAEGDYAMLQRAGDQLGFGVTHLGTMVFDHDRVSSTRIRDALASGDFMLAEKLLGRKYFMMGTVVVGQRMGRELGTPTANIRLQRYRSALEGIFAVTVQGLEREYEGSAYVGTRPTVDGTEPLLEVHLFDFDGDIYGRRLTVTFHHKFREDVKYEGLEPLKKQIAKDLEMTRDWFAAHRADLT
ncbi:MAG: bifunctional riboflavin kinase/FAD synthetase [Gammaproteobacteria bacterium]|nr:bifunctional riboflavin kinase/FAD synthetase [Gammaproteobacteria bacterium]